MVFLPLKYLHFDISHIIFAGKEHTNTYTMKTDYILIRQRDARLWRDYYNTRNNWYESHRIFTEKELINHVITHCQPPYHLTYDYAYRIAKVLLNEHRNPSVLSLKQQMWYEFAGQVKNYLQRHPNSALETAVSEVLANCRASRYFISYHTARRVINKQKHANCIFKYRA